MSVQNYLSNNMAALKESPEIINRNIKAWNIPVPTQRYKVVIHCSTYNHEKYIEDALKGFVMQQTNFSFCAIVIDDGSPDHTAEIIRKYAKEYPDIIKPICLGYNHMQHSLSRNPYFDCWHEVGEYLAQCEGDDYWIDPQKLQKQVDFMDQHPDYGMIHTDFDLTEGTRNHNSIKENKDDVYFPSILTDGMLVGTCTTLIRLSFLNQCPKYSAKEGWPMGDYPMWIELAYISKIKYLKDVTAKYRVLANSASHSDDIYKMIKFKNASIAITQFYANLYGIKLDSLYTDLYYESIVRYACRLGRKDVAREYFEIAKQEKMINWKTILFYVCTKYPLIKRVLELYRKV